MNQIYYSELVCAIKAKYILWCMQEVKQNNINRIKVTKKIRHFFLNSNIKHHGVLTLFDNRKPVRRVSVLTF